MLTTLNDPEGRILRYIRTDLFITEILCFVVVIYKEFTFQATGSDQAFGYGLMATAGIIFTYYTLWIVIMVRKLFSVVIYPLPKTRNVTHLCTFMCNKNSF